MSKNLQHPGRMSQAMSSFLDALRVLAALIVFAVHCTLLRSPAAQYGMTGTVGHDAVIIFFVLSGYVIAYSTFSKHSNIKDYTISRLARLYSVVIPALILTFTLHLLAGKLHPALYSAIDRGNSNLRYVLAALFLQEAWKLSASPPSNGPLWSLGYEFWYYALFGAAIFLKSRAWKSVMLFLFALVVGPKVLLLMPVWILGVLVFTHGQKAMLPISLARVSFFAALIVLICVFGRVPSVPYHVGLPPLAWSSAFLSDWGMGLLVALIIWLFQQAFSQTLIPVPVNKSVRWAANHTFSLYLYHSPLLMFATAIVPFNRLSPALLSALVIAILAIVLVLSTFTEAKRGVWQKWISTSWDVLARLHRKLLLSYETESVANP